MKKMIFISFALGLALCTQASAQAGDFTATAKLKGTDEQNVGTVWFSKAEKGVKVTAEVTGLPDGEHAFHIHGTGTCTAPDFKSAGGHYNPKKTEHGFLSPKGPHAGDMPNITVGGNGKYEWTTALVSLDDGAENTLFPKGGTAIVIHLNPDDYITDPAGSGGTRIACGLIEKVK